MKEKSFQEWLEKVDRPQAGEVERSRRRLRSWFEQTAPLVRWDVIESPVGRLYLAATPQGLCSVDFGIATEVFLEQLDPLARTEHDPAGMAEYSDQLREYFSGARRRFEIPVDLARLTPFQRSVLQVTQTIRAGSVWTYRQVAEAIGRPKASRPVGMALAHNPVPIVIPCHRVIASDGSLGGYSAGAGPDSKRRLLQFEGALGA